MAKPRKYFLPGGWIMWTLISWFPHVPVALEFFVLLGAAIATFFVLRKTVYRPVKEHFERVGKGMDTLLGYPAVLDPGSNREIQPATPPLAARVYDLEKNGADVSTALMTIANNQKQILELQKAFEERAESGDKLVEEWTHWREEHEEEAKEREDRIHSWEQWRAEQTTLWELVRTNLAIEASKPNEPPETL